MKYFILPVPKPRMTRRYKSLNPPRPCVKRYWHFKERVRQLGISVKDGDCVVFHIPMPESWGKKKKVEMLGKHHKQRPDIDDYLKALLDSIFDDDSHISHLEVKKIWSDQPAIEIID